MTEQNLTAMEEQLARLQEAIVAKRASEGVATERPVERVEVHQALGEQAVQAIPSFVPSAPPQATAAPTDIPAELAQTVQELVAVAFTEGPLIAIDRAVKSKNPALIDCIHDVLTGAFHEELLKRQKIAPAP
jgi:hypothetical protein